LIEVTGGIEGGGVKGRFHRVLMASLKAGRGGRCGATAGDAALQSRGGEPKEGETPDGRGPAGSEREEREEGEVGRRRAVFGPEEELGRGERAGRWAKRKKRKRGERGLGFLFLFKPFQTFKFKLFSNLKHFKPFSKFSKQFKNF
jgi:hypothetical protein